jgi:stage II sporulation protein D
MDRQMMTKHTKMMSLTAAFLLTISILFPLWLNPTLAAVPKLDQIRVALFIEARGTVPTVTLSAANGLHIGNRTPSGIIPWITHTGSSQIRSSVDQYMIHIVETNDYIIANNAAKLAKDMVGEAYIVSIKKQEQTFYRVYAGQFPNEIQANSAKNQLASQAVFGSYNLSLSGPLHLSAGTYDSLDAAEHQVNLILQSGLYAYLVYHENNEGKVVYSVWMGEAANSSQLDKVKAEAIQTLPGLNLEIADNTKPYLLKRNQTFFNGSNTITPHYFFNAVGQKVWISSEDSNIQVLERSNRLYRGSIELSSYKNRLTVINDVAFEQYLYSVVGSELSSSWPTEALKAQAVAARTFALSMGMKYGIAHVSDTTYEQAYYGVNHEFPAAIDAVQATKGEVLVDKKGLITAFYYSNAGGMTADTSEIWGTPLDYIKSVPSPDNNAEKDKLLWNRVVLSNGIIGYIRSDFTRRTQDVNAAGFPVVTATESGVNVRSAPYVNNETNPAINQTYAGERMVLIEQQIESNAYSWIRGLFTAEQMLTKINSVSKTQISGTLQTIEVTQRGPSGRVIEMKANGQLIQVGTPDSYRTAMNALPSTRFDVEETGRYTILGSDGQKNFPENNDTLYVLSASEETDSQPRALTSQEMLVMNGKSEARLITKDPQFRFIGLGFGHGIGMSQWGARELAEFVGYDYQQILKYYYNDVTIVKD